jgi:dolichol-phosphate mannosyltransferase
MKSLIIIPTYNERENVVHLIPAVLSVTSAETEVLVVDDNSPDGTADIVRQLQTQSSRVHLLLRQKKEGLGRAYIAGFQWGLTQGFEVLTEMDADFSHRPEDLVKILLQARSSDFVVGSRYVPGGRTVNWGVLRKLISRGGSLYSRMILGFPLRDWTGGFNAWHRRVLEQMGLANIQSNGYSFQIELKYRALKLGFKGTEVPIVFEDRRVGQSKMSFKIVIEAFYRVWLIKHL